MQRRGRAFLPVLLLGTMACSRADNAPAPAPTSGDYHLEDAFPALRFDRPLWIGHAGDGSGRLFVVEQAGRVHVFEGRRDVQRSTVFLDISGRVRREHNEEGLLALAFHPSYAANGLFYVYYSASNPLRNVLARFQVVAADSNRADPTSQRILLEIPKPYGNHNGATLDFGPDGYLYVSIGDGGAAGDPHGNAQNLGALLGKILRLDVDVAGGGAAYEVPADNPFARTAGARREIWAFGLRNVWRMSFDRATGDLWAGDVGQDRWEEIDRIVRGGNYGWNRREGRHAYRGGRGAPGDVEPVWEYGHDLGASVTGGYVVHDPSLPELAGAYVYADFVTGTIWALRGLPDAPANTTLAAQPRNIASFGEGPQGELYVVAFDGKIYRLVANPASASQPATRPAAPEAP